MMARLAAVSVLLLVAVACSPDRAAENTRTETMEPKAEIRSDIEPLTKRYPAIGAPKAVTWVTWNSASGGGAPGPTTYWIDAVVELEPQTTTSLIDHTQPAPEGKTPEITEALSAELPPGPFLTGAQLDKALSTSGWATTAYLDRDRNQLVLHSMDD